MLLFPRMMTSPVVQIILKPSVNDAVLEVLHFVRGAEGDHTARAPGAHAACG